MSQDAHWIVGSTHLPMDVKSLAQSRSARDIWAVDSETRDLFAGCLVAGGASESEASETRGEC